MSNDKDTSVAHHFAKTRRIVVRWLDVDNAKSMGMTLPEYLRMKYDLCRRDWRVHGEQ